VISGIHLQGQLLDRTHFNSASGFKDRTALRDFYRVRQILGLDQHVASNEILRLDVGTVGDDLLFAGNRLAGRRQWRVDTVMALLLIVLSS
jgi:hypothetical protein